MPNYQNGKIYKIVCNNTGKQYIGSTTQKYLTSRLAKHRDIYLKGNKRFTSKEVLEGGNYNIVLIENCPCNSKDELQKRERHFIETLECVNKTIPGRTRKEYYETYKEKAIERATKWNKENKEKRNEIMTCICGKSITKSVKARHEKSQYHLKRV